MEYDGRRPRVPRELAERIDAVRGQVPFERWVREALERAVQDAPRLDVRPTARIVVTEEARERPKSPSPKPESKPMSADELRAWKRAQSNRGGRGVA